MIFFLRFSFEFVLFVLFDLNSECCILTIVFSIDKFKKYGSCTGIGISTDCIPSLLLYLFKTEHTFDLIRSSEVKPAFKIKFEISIATNELVEVFKLSNELSLRLLNISVEELFDTR